MAGTGGAGVPVVSLEESLLDSRPASWESAFPGVSSVLWKAVEAQAFPGAVAAWGALRGRGAKAEGQERALAVGNITFESSLRVTADSLWDVASLTKVLATVPACMLLLEEGKLKLSDRVASIVPEFVGEGKASLTVRHLLTHTAGLKECFTFTPSAFPEAPAPAPPPTPAAGTGSLDPDADADPPAPLPPFATGASGEAFARPRLYRPTQRRRGGECSRRSSRSRCGTRRGTRQFIPTYVRAPQGLRRAAACLRRARAKRSCERELI